MDVALVGPGGIRHAHAVRYSGNPHSTHAAQQSGGFHFACDLTYSCALRGASAVGSPRLPSYGFHGS